MKTLKAHGNIHEGKLKLYNSAVFKQAISDIGFASDVRMSLEYGTKRSLDQNSYMWGGIVASITTRLRQDGWDFTPDETYLYLQNKFSALEMVNEETGEMMKIVKPFKSLSTIDFAEKVDLIRGWAHENLGIYIQKPHEFYGMDEPLYEAWKRGEITNKQAIKLSKTKPIPSPRGNIQ